MMTLALGPSRRSYGMPPLCILCLVLSSALVSTAFAAATAGSQKVDIIQPRQYRRLLQDGDTSVSVCDPSTGQLDDAAVLALASQLLGDTRLRLADARFTGDCRQLGAGVFTAPNPVAQQLSGAAILSTGQATLAVATNPNTTTPSSGFNTPGDPSLGASSVDAAFLEVDVVVGSLGTSTAQLALNYCLASAEFASSSPAADRFLVQMAVQFSERATNVAVLPGGATMPGPGTLQVPAPAKLELNSNNRLPTALRGWTTVLPTQGFPVRSGAVYTVRLAVANSLTSTFDSSILVPFKSLTLAAPGTAAAGGPYSGSAGQTLQLDGSRSVAAAGSYLAQYRWRVLSASNASVVLAETSSNSPTANITAPAAAGTYPVNLTIWSDLGAVSSAATSLVVTAAAAAPAETPSPSPAPAAEASPSPAPTTTASTPTTVPASPPPAGVVTVVTVGAASSPPPAPEQPPPPPASPPPPPGVPVRPIPVLRIPGGPTILARSDTVNTMVTLDATQSYDNVGSLLNVSWNIIRTKPTVGAIDLGFSAAGPAVFVFPFQAGEYLVTADVGGPGGRATAQQLLVVAANRQPVASAGGPYLATVNVPFTVSAERSFDPDNDGLTYTWQLTRGMQALGTFTGMTLTMAVHREGEYTLQLSVDDGRGGQSTTITEISAYADQVGGNDNGVTSNPSAPAGPAPAPTTSPRPLQDDEWLPAPSPPPPSGVVTPANTPGGVNPAANPTPAPAPAPAPTGSNAPSGGGGSIAEGFLMGVIQALATGPQRCLVVRDNDGILRRAAPFQPLSWSAPFWADCSLVGTAGAPSPSTPGTPGTTPSALVTTAVIKSPEAFVPATGQATQIQLDATGSSTPAGRTIVSWRWDVRRAADSSSVGTYTGISNSLWLGTGTYLVSLTVGDSAGQTGVASRTVTVATTGSSPTPAPAGPAAPTPSSSGTRAVMAQPAANLGGSVAFVPQTDSDGATVRLSATGSAAAAGRSISAYDWIILRLPDQAVMMQWNQGTGSIKLPGGSYAVGLTVKDSAGGNATVVREMRIGTRNTTTGLGAVITWPPSAVAAAGASTTVALDATGSAAGSNRNISTYLWAIVSLPKNTPAAQGEGRLATVSLPRGNYTVGLMVVDSDGNKVTAKKNIMVADPPDSSDSSSATSGGNRMPIINTDLSFSGTAGGSFRITGVRDPDSDTLAIEWSLMNAATGSTTKGTGSTVSLRGISAGSYILLINADDNKGGVATGSAQVTVRASTSTGSPTPQPSSSGSSGDRGATPTFNRFPNITMPAGGLLQLDAGLLTLLPAGALVKSYQWSLTRQGSTQALQTLYGRTGKFTPDTPGTYSLALSVVDTAGKSYRSVTTIRATAPLTAGAAEGACGPWSAQQFSNVTLRCNGVTVSGTTSPAYLWRLTRASDRRVWNSTRPRPSFGGLDPGQYQVQVWVAPKSPAAATTAAYALVSHLTVSRRSSMQLVPPASACIGSPVELKAPRLVLPSGLRAAYSWAVVLRQPSAPLLAPEPLTGVGSTFTFVPEAGNYTISVTGTISGTGSSAAGNTLVGTTSLTPTTCWKAACKSGRQRITVDRRCNVPLTRAAALLRAQAPSGYRVVFGPSSVLSLGDTQVTVVAQPPTTLQPTTTCTALVSIRDTAAPQVRLRNSRGGCVAPANNNWHCFAANALVNVTDNCPGAMSAAYTCAAGSGADVCRVVGGNQACVRAATTLADGATVSFDVVMRDAAGNAAPALTVPVAVRKAATSGCPVPSLTQAPGAAAAGAPIAR